MVCGREADCYHSSVPFSTLSSSHTIIGYQS
uniref:Uncharacterized protein n=1 Tax=Arundo donax TaxID=35708 RepID=A0A0A9CDD1_ARUDO